MAEDFDFIVVGSGAGGGPLAANLARAGFQVLLLEAGGDSCKESVDGQYMYEVPIFHGLCTEYPECRWDYFVKHYSDPLQQSLDNKFVRNDPETNLSVDGIWYPRAGTLGGCTAHNAMITVTPQDSDWDMIADITGDNTWCAETMNKYFARLENCHYQPRPRTVKYILDGLLWSLLALWKRENWRDWTHGHGFDGWLTTSESDPNLVLGDRQIVRILLSAIKVAFRTGIEHPILAFLTRLDPNDTRNSVHAREGLAFTPLAVSGGKRNGPRDYLRRTEETHSNLKIQLHCFVTKVKFEGNRAIGVEFIEGKHLYQADPIARSQSAKESLPSPRIASASREVILAGGAFNSPQLLKLSGIGPRKELEKLGICVRVDLPGVGENLQDRYEVSVISDLPEPFTLLKGATFKPPIDGKAEEEIFNLWRTGRGLYTSNGSLVGILKRSRASLLEPDLYIFGLPGTFAGYEPGYSEKFERTRNRFSWVILKAFTKNRVGTVNLRSKDPLEWPEINFNYFSAETGVANADLTAVVKGIEFVRQMNTAFRAKPSDEKWPGIACDTPGKLAEFVRNQAWGHHASCTNKIGADNDPFAVLNSRFEVRGTKGLRVVDASVFPSIPGYFIVSAVYMVSEKASDVIIEDAK
jgi:choline dehydrogenase